MKILMFSLLLTLGLNANEVVYGSKSGTIERVDFDDAEETIVNLGAGEAIEIMSVIGIQKSGDTIDYGATTNLLIIVKDEDLPAMVWQEWQPNGSSGVYRKNNDAQPVISNMLVGPCSIKLISPYVVEEQQHIYKVSYKITKPAASNTTTSAPILLPPTPNAAASWFVKLQMSSDLKTWEDVQAGQFLGSDAARFFRIQTTEGQ